MTQLVPRYLLGELPPAASVTGDLTPYLGRYVANFATFSNEVFTISERNGRLRLDIPSQLESALNPPRADGRRSTDFVGRAIYQVERVEVGAELSPDTFTLGATSAPRASVPRP